MNAPCKGCKTRSPTCHAECQRYLEYAAEREQFRNKRFIFHEYNEKRRTAAMKRK